MKGRENRKHMPSNKMTDYGQVAKSRRQEIGHQVAKSRTVLSVMMKGQDDQKVKTRSGAKIVEGQYEMVVKLNWLNPVLKGHSLR